MEFSFCCCISLTFFSILTSYCICLCLIIPVCSLSAVFPSYLDISTVKHCIDEVLKDSLSLSILICLICNSPSWSKTLHILANFLDRLDSYKAVCLIWK